MIRLVSGIVFRSALCSVQLTLFQIDHIFLMESSPYPRYQKCDNFVPNADCRICVLTHQQSEQVPENWRQDFISAGRIIIWNQKQYTIFVTPKKALNQTITGCLFVEFSLKTSVLQNYFGIASTLLATAYTFSRKSCPKNSLTVKFSEQSMPNHSSILKLVESKNRSKEWAMGRGDIDGTPQFFESQALKLKQLQRVKVSIIKGDDLIKEGFRLMHAVGRASKNAPVFINLAYNGNPDSDKWVAFVGKGVCFDTGGLQLKSTDGIKNMYLDKHGACSVFSAFQTIAEEELKINVTCSMGFVENFVNENSYRPSDIITSRKGLTVEIGNTDAEGRLVLADCMHWTQEFYKVDVLIEQSTLTGAILTALGNRYAGVFSNDDELISDLRKAGYQTNEEVWHMPVNEYYHQLLNSKFADVANSNMIPVGGSCQAAGFLQRFVQAGVKWCHMDILGMAIVCSQGTGFGSRILVQYARNYISKC